MPKITVSFQKWLLTDRFDNAPERQIIVGGAGSGVGLPLEVPLV